MTTSATDETTTVETVDAPAPNIARRLAVEGIGTFFLVFTVGTAVHGGSSLAPLASILQGGSGLA
ncbi:hypothetical protein [Nocardia sp. NPDC051570]|uniref:hypothetical protein n=1 Tax=Nocardia sp. NPDC051570 TaxID=3364324 RepID=UPI00379297FC